MESSKEFLYDKRIVERHVRQGLISREAYQAEIERLPDLSERLDRIRVKLEPVQARPTGRGRDVDEEDEEEAGE